MLASTSLFRFLSTNVKASLNSYVMEKGREILIGKRYWSEGVSFRHTAHLVVQTQGAPIVGGNLVQRLSLPLITRNTMQVNGHVPYRAASTLLSWRHPSQWNHCRWQWSTTALGFAESNLQNASKDEGGPPVVDGGATQPSCYF